MRPLHQGVINLRGTIVPIVDLRIKFNLGKIEYTPFTVVIILNVAGRVIGTVVDSVSDVISLTGRRFVRRPISRAVSIPATSSAWRRSNSG
jgi:purine-binding chemotaxis protein CheW